MSALTDFFSSLAGKIRSKLGTSRTYTPAEAVAAIDDVYNKGVTDTKKGNAERSHVLSPKTFTSLSAGVNQTGSMPDKSGWKSTGHNLNSKTVQQVSIPAGYHNGSGYIEFNSLSSQTGVDSGKTAIIAGAIKSGYQGWVNGQKITGTLSLSGDAASNHVLYGKTFYNNTWTKQTGSMPNRGTIPTKYLNGGETYTIPDGYHSGSGKVIANTVGDQTKVDPGKTAIDPGAVKAGYQGWVNGQKITGTLSLSGNAPNAYVLSSYTFYNNTWTKQTGSMPSRSSSSQVPENKAWPYNNRMYFGVEYGYYPAASFGGMSNVSEKYITYDALARDIGLNSRNLVKGATCLGITGTAISYHDITYTPSSTTWNSAGADMGEYHTYRFVNTSICYNEGASTGRQRQKYYGKMELAGTGTWHSFHFTGLAGGRNYRYFYVFMLQQTGGTYMGVGSGAKSYPAGSHVSSDGDQPIEQVSCQSANTQGLGGMVMRSCGAFTLNEGGSYADIYMVINNNITGYWCCYLWGAY